MSETSSSIKDFVLSIKNILIILLILVIAGGLYTFVKNKKSLINDYETLLSDTAQYYVTQRVVDGRVISEQKQRITGLQAAVAMGDVKLNDLKSRNFKSVQTVIRLRTENRVLNDSIKFLTQPEIIVVKDESGIPKDYMKIPMEFAKESKWYSIFGDVNKSGILIDSMLMFSDPTIYIGKQWKHEKGIFKTLRGTKPMITYENANPYISVISMDNNVIIEPEKWYETGWFKFLCGAIAGTGTVVMLNK